MKTSLFKAVRCGCVVLVVSLGLSVFAVWNLPHGDAAGVGCYGTRQTHGDVDAPQICSLDDSCVTQDDCEPFHDDFIDITESFYVGSCEVACCPDTARCLFCDGVIVCAEYNTYTHAVYCENDINPVPGMTAKNDKCDGSEGT